MRRTRDPAGTVTGNVNETSPSPGALAKTAPGSRRGKRSEKACTTAGLPLPSASSVMIQSSRTSNTWLPLEVATSSVASSDARNESSESDTVTGAAPVFSRTST